MPKASGAILPDNARISTQWTRRMNSLKLWLTLRVHGRQAYEEHIARQMELTAQFARWVEDSEIFELVVPPTLPILNLRLKNGNLAAAHAALVEEVTRDGQLWISDTVVNGDSAIRVMIISYLTEQRHLQALQSALTAAAEKLRSPLPT
jgi:aromatic-L-amino-acid/L-tryptophan decarboxylase